MKVLLCTPYKGGPDLVRGGINQWGQNILSYYETHKDGIEVIPVSFDRHVSHISTDNSFQRVINGIREQLSPIRKAQRIMKENKPDVIHICSSAGMGCIRDLLLVRAAKKKNIRSVLHLHFGRLPELAEKKNWEWNLLTRVIKRSDVVVPMNKPTESVLVQNGFRNVKYLPNPLSDTIDKRIAELMGTIERNPRVILYVGHVYESKGVVELVTGCKGIQNIDLRIVGKCTKDMHDKLASIGAVNGNSDWIKFVGEVSHEDVLKEFMKAGLFVFPSYTEGFPNVILEAMACKCPIIASNVGAIPEMLDIDNVPCGICIKPKSSEAVQEGVLKLLEDYNKKDVYVTKARQRVATFYSMPVVWKELTAIWANE